MAEIDETLIQQLIDGRLTPEQRTKLLLDVELHPRGWQTIAKAFIEEQVLRENTRGLLQEFGLAAVASDAHELPQSELPQSELPQSESAAVKDGLPRATSDQDTAMHEDSSSREDSSDLVERPQRGSPPANHSAVWGWVSQVLAVTAALLLGLVLGRDFGVANPQTPAGKSTDEVAGVGATSEHRGGHPKSSATVPMHPSVPGDLAANGQANTVPVNGEAITLEPTASDQPLEPMQLMLQPLIGERMRDVIRQNGLAVQEQPQILIVEGKDGTQYVIPHRLVSFVRQQTGNVNSSRGK